jgi:hypothetical protein
LTLCYIYGMTNRESAKMKVKEDWSINYGLSIILPKKLK